MLGRIRHYLSVYRGFLACGFATGLSFRVNFVLMILMDLFFYASSLFATSFIFDQVDRIGEWNKDQFLFFVSFMLAVDHLHMTFISEGFWGFSFDLRVGKLDFFLLKPIGTLFTVFFQNIRPSTLCNLPVPWILMIHYGNQAGLGGWDWVFLLPLILLALTLLVALEIVIAMAMFWTVESWGLNFLRMQLQQVSRWPSFIYGTWVRRLFTFFFPVLLIGSAPVSFLLDGKVMPLIGMLLAIPLTCLVIRFLWGLGLKSYESASS